MFSSTRYSRSDCEDDSRFSFSSSSSPQLQSSNGGGDNDVEEVIFSLRFFNKSLLNHFTLNILSDLIGSE